MTTAARPEIEWGRVLFGFLLGAGVLALGLWGLRVGSVDAQWPGAQAPATVHARLEATVRRDHAAVEKHYVNRWVPQLLLTSASHPDLSPATAAAHDLDDFVPLRKKYKALLLRDFQYNFGTRGAYVSVVPRAYRSPQQALAWCRKAHLGPSRCVAKRLTHGPVARTVVTH